MENRLSREIFLAKRQVLFTLIAEATIQFFSVIGGDTFPQL